jgi:hypothetical protein
MISLHEFARKLKNIERTSVETDSGIRMELVGIAFLTGLTCFFFFVSNGFSAFLLSRRMSSNTASSTLILCFADVEKNGTPYCCARFLPSSIDT